jgi:hypothetical protein
MIAFWLVLIAGVLIGVTYLTLAARSFARVRRDVMAAAESGAATQVADFPDEMHRGFVWKALGGVCASTLVIVLLGVDSVFWYLPVILALGTGVAVIAAFVIDSRSSVQAEIGIPSVIKEI